MAKFIKLSKENIEKLKRKGRYKTRYEDEYKSLIPTLINIGDSDYIIVFDIPYNKCYNLANYLRKNYELDIITIWCKNCVKFTKKQNRNREAL